MTINLEDIRVVDLTKRLVPGEEERRLEIRRGVIESDDTFMHEIDTMSHIGTHVEAPSHFYEDGKDIAQLPIESFIGRAVVLDVSFLEPRAQVLGEHLAAAAGGRLRARDIVILRSAHHGASAPSLTADAARWLAARDIKMLGIDDSVGLGASAEVVREVHDVLMGRDVPFLEVLVNLDALSAEECFLVAAPLRIEGLDSSPVRAFAFQRTRET
ncbi:MAG: cyclase family protein [Armatimonadota bacterium]